MRAERAAADTRRSRGLFKFVKKLLKSRRLCLQILKTPPMTDILCKWLNENVKLSEKIDSVNFTKAFGSGFLLGELMSKYGLQEDFKSFSPGSNTDAKLNNFSRLEPSLRLLQVPFNSNIVSQTTDIYVPTTSF
eukprot:sb/3474780/